MALLCSALLQPAPRPLKTIAGCASLFEVQKQAGAKVQWSRTGRPTDPRPAPHHNKPPRPALPCRAPPCPALPGYALPGHACPSPRIRGLLTCAGEHQEEVCMCSSFTATCPHRSSAKRQGGRDRTRRKPKLQVRDQVSWPTTCPATRRSAHVNRCKEQEMEHTQGGWPAPRNLVVRLVR